jgi:hypothetical protein
MQTRLALRHVRGVPGRATQAHSGTGRGRAERLCRGRGGAVVAYCAFIRLLVRYDERFLRGCEGGQHRPREGLWHRRSTGVCCRPMDVRLRLWDDRGRFGHEGRLLLLARHRQQVHLGVFETAIAGRVTATWPGQARRIRSICKPSPKEIHRHKFLYTEIGRKRTRFDIRRVDVSAVLLAVWAETLDVAPAVRTLATD